MCQAKSIEIYVIGGYAVNYYGYHSNTEDLDIWIAPTNENKEYFYEYTSCMNYSEEEVTPLYKEDFTHPFKATIGSENASCDLSLLST